MPQRKVETMPSTGKNMGRWDYAVVIVGAGPVGGRAATLLSQDGLRVLMLEEHEEIGRPFQALAWSLHPQWTSLEVITRCWKKWTVP